jgi:hypothetical protein
MNLTNPPPIERTPSPRLTISNLVAAVRDELDKIEAERQAAARKPLFRLSKMEINVQFVVTVDETVKGGFDLKVVSVGGEREASSERTQSVTLTYDVLQNFRGLTSIVAAMPPDPDAPKRDDGMY